MIKYDVDCLFNNLYDDISLIINKMNYYKYTEKQLKQDIYSIIYEYSIIFEDYIIYELKQKNNDINIYKNITTIMKHFNLIKNSFNIDNHQIEIVIE